MPHINKNTHFNVDKIPHLPKIIQNVLTKQILLITYSKNHIYE